MLSHLKIQIYIQIQIQIQTHIDLTDLIDIMEKEREKRDKDVQGQLLSICIQFSQRKMKQIGRNARNLKKQLYLYTFWAQTYSAQSIPGYRNIASSELCKFISMHVLFGTLLNSLFVKSFPWKAENTLVFTFDIPGKQINLSRALVRNLHWE